VNDAAAFDPRRCGTVDTHKARRLPQAYRRRPIIKGDKA
jgi:hypothetical protein